MIAIQLAYTTMGLFQSQTDISMKPSAAIKKTLGRIL